MRNPVYWLEMRVRVREKRLWILALFFTIALLTLAGVVLAASLLGPSHTKNPAQIGSGLSWSFLFCQAGLLVLLAPLATAGRISQEREQRTLPGLINSPISPLRIAWGKLLGSWVFVIWLATVTVPFVLVATLWGGPTTYLVIASMGFNVAAGLTLSAVSLGLSGIFGRSLTAYLVTGAFLFAWIVVVPLLGSLAAALNTASTSGYETTIAYLAFYHHPFFPLSLFASSKGALTIDALGKLAYCLGVWGLIAVIFFLLAIKGLKREVY